MSSDDMLKEMLAIMSGDSPMPDRVTNRMLLAGMIELYRKSADMNERMLKIEVWQSLITEKERMWANIMPEKEAKFVSWPWLLEKIAQPAIIVILASLIASVLSKSIP